MAEITLELKQLLATLQRSQDTFRKHVIPIFEDNDRGQPEVHGTALVVSWRGRMFLLSAAHVFDPLAEGRGMYVYSDISTKRWLSGQLRQTPKPNGSRDRDLLDVGVLALSGPSLPPYPNVKCTPLEGSLLLPTRFPREGTHFLALGYPSRKSSVNTQRKKVGPVPYANYGPSIKDERYRELQLDPSSHIAIAFHHGSVLGTAGNMQTFPKPHGMSGSPLWLLYDERNRPREFKNFPVAGILIEYRPKDKVLLATDIAVALSMIGDAVGEETIYNGSVDFVVVAGHGSSTRTDDLPHRARAPLQRRFENAYHQGPIGPCLPAANGCVGAAYSRILHSHRARRKP